MLDGNNRHDFAVTKQERSFIEPTTPQPSGHLVIGFAGVARPAGGHDVVEGVSTPAGYREDTVTLERSVRCTAIRATSPGLLQDDPVFIGQIVLDAIHTALAFSGGPSAPGSTDGHTATIRITPGESGPRSAQALLSREPPSTNGSGVRDGIRARGIVSAAMTETADLEDPPSPNDKEVLCARTRAAWRSWLEAHGDRTHGLWLVYRKKSSALLGPTYEELLEEALCFGWIDSQSRRVDDDRTMQWFSPRRRGSIWSEPNKVRVDRLERDGLMAEPGRNAVSRAKADGSWSQTDEVDALIIPPDLDAAFAAAPRARSAYLALPDSVKRQTLWSVYSAKRPQTRTTRVTQTIATLEAGSADVPDQ